MSQNCPLHPNSLSPEKAVLLVVDLQTAFAAAIPEFSELVNRASVMVRGCKLLGIPVAATEQVPAKLGSTAEPLRAVLADITPIEKTIFSAYPAAASQLKDRSQIILCGIETHICINQTAHDLLAAGMQVHLLVDAIGSRFPHDREAGLNKMFKAGAIPSTVELALFEMMRDSKHEHFRAIQKLVK
ncbi:MAG TPA: isochorismatase family protein [Tepidisphaeraceae bacterium]|nr:isochorismatase family protein [Tepidisphaeraceae bacterium]